MRRFERQHLAIQHPAPLAPQGGSVTDGGLEVVVHQPLGDQVRLGERAQSFSGGWAMSRSTTTERVCEGAVIDPSC